MRFMAASRRVTEDSQRVRSRAFSSWPRAAVFDCDGLLVDSARCWQHAYARVAAERGGSIDDIRLERLLGAAVSRAASLVSQDLGRRVSAGELRTALGESFAAEPPQALTGARQLVAALAARMPVGVASNAPRDIVIAVLEQLGLREAFSAVVSAEETRRHKPQPHVYLEACRRLAVPPCDAVAFEDSPLGARAARTAGLLVVLVPSVPARHSAADLIVPRLSDPRVGELLGLDDVANGSGRGPSRRVASAMSS